MQFGPDLSATIAAGDALAAGLWKWVAALCEKRGIPVPWELPPPLVLDSRTVVDLAREGITSVIWTTGYRPQYDWVHFPVFDDMGFPIQTEGHSDVDGLYFAGVHFQRRSRSATLYGVAEDAEILVDHIVRNRK